MENKNIIICIGRQLGSGGHDIGRMLAAEFDAKYYDRELLNLAAKESGFSKKVFERNGSLKPCSAYKRLILEVVCTTQTYRKTACSSSKATPSARLLPKETVSS